MANIQIKDLPAVTTVAEGDVFHINELATSGDRKITFLNLESFLFSRNKANNTEAVQGLIDTRFNTPQGTKAHVDARIATQLQAETGTDNTVLMTPLRTGQLISNLTPSLGASDYAIVISAPTQLEINKKYHITSSSLITLPTVAGLSVGDRVRVTKAISATPNITVQGVTETIRVGKGLGVFESNDTVIFDIDAELIFIFNGTNWEV